MNMLMNLINILGEGIMNEIQELQNEIGHVKESLAVAENTIRNHAWVISIS